MEKFHRKLLATSLPRSGSRFLTKVLRNAQVKVGHEALKSDGTVSMFFAVEDCWYPGKHWSTDDEERQRRSDYEFEQVWHFVRDPRWVIPSMASQQLPGNVWCWQERHTGISAGVYPKLLRSMLFWVAWNELIEKNEKVDFFFRIEDIDTHWPEICSRLGIDMQEYPTVPEVDRQYGTVEKGPKRNRPLSYEAMGAIDPAAALRVREMGHRYGYTGPTPPERVFEEDR